MIVVVVGKWMTEFDSFFLSFCQSALSIPFSYLFSITIITLVILPWHASIIVTVLLSVNDHCLLMN